MRTAPWPRARRAVTRGKRGLAGAEGQRAAASGSILPPGSRAALLTAPHPDLAEMEGQLLASATDSLAPNWNTCPTPAALPGEAESHPRALAGALPWEAGWVLENPGRAQACGAGTPPCQRCMFLRLAPASGAAAARTRLWAEPCAVRDAPGRTRGSREGSAGPRLHVLPPAFQADQLLLPNDKTQYYREFLGVVPGRGVQPEEAGEATQALCGQLPIYWRTASPPLGTRLPSRPVSLAGPPKQRLIYLCIDICFPSNICVSICFYYLPE
uniref:Uncharacterized protein n=1 Tax=Varanus komodoensis TaxID=61221 RepID=A0A8D2LMJ3_VARKO